MGSRAHARYLIELAAFVALLAFVSLPAYIEIAPENVHGREYALWSQQLAFARTPTAQEPALLVIGDSRAHAAILPDALASALGEPARSLALGGSLPIDGYYLLRTYLEHHAAPRAILVSYAPDHLERRSFGVFWERSVKFGAHDFAAFREISARAEALGVALRPGFGRPRALVEWWLYRLHFPVYYRAELKASRLVGRRAANLETMAGEAASGGHAFYGALDHADGVIEEAGRERFTPSPLVDAYLRDLLALAARSARRVVYLPMPVSERSFAAIDPAYRAGHAAYLRELRNATPGAQVESALRVLPDDHFGDRSHVNARGARRTTREVAALLRAS